MEFGWRAQALLFPPLVILTYEGNSFQVKHVQVSLIENHQICSSFIQNVKQISGSIKLSKVQSIAYLSYMYVYFGIYGPTKKYK